MSATQPTFEDQLAAIGRALDTRIAEIQTTPGPAGPQGEAGPVGPQGPQGETGPVGPAGSTATVEPQPLPVADVYVTVDRSQPIGTSALKPGAVLIQNTLTSGNQAVIDKQLGVLASASSVASLHTMGFGAPNTWPCKAGPLSWGYLDNRISQAEGAGQDIILTIGMAPTWMTYGGVDCTTNWDNIEAAPMVKYFADMASYAGQVAARYAGRVTGYTLWNEFKGFWSLSLNRHRHEDLTTLYNQCYAAIKAADPAALVGGPYAPVRAYQPGVRTGEPAPGAANYLAFSNGAIADGRTMTAVLYWLANNAGYDFFSLDGVNRYPDEFMAWIRGQGVTKPVVWMEFYADASDTMLIDEARALQAENYRKALLGGAETMLIWAPQSGTTPFNYMALWDGQGNELPFAGMLRAFRDTFPPGTGLYQVDVDSPDVTAAASNTATLIINRSGLPLDVAVGQTVVTLEPWAVAVVRD